MNEEIKIYIEKYPTEIIDLFQELRKLIYNSVSVDIEEKMWAKLPTYYVCESFVRLIPFKDHINVEAKAIINYKDELSGFKITPKGMLQVFVNQELPFEILKKVFIDALIK
ncbi:MAG: DUF1801 domain-containing protein [Bacilli bacterium]|nr:DUF1801 domain-containing protein [Bacilli bacterium]